MSYWIHPKAEAELGNAAEHYARLASKAVAYAYLEEFERVLALLERNQQLGTIVSGGLRIYPFKRFPYSIVYRDDESRGPQVLAVAHQRREPEYWHGRQEQRC